MMNHCSIRFAITIVMLVLSMQGCGKKGESANVTNTSAKEDGPTYVNNRESDKYFTSPTLVEIKVENLKPGRRITTAKLDDYILITELVKGSNSGAQQSDGDKEKDAHDFSKMSGEELMQFCIGDTTPAEFETACKGREFQAMGDYVGFNPEKNFSGIRIKGRRIAFYNLSRDYRKDDRLKIVGSIEGTNDDKKLAVKASESFLLIEPDEETRINRWKQIAQACKGQGVNYIDHEVNDTTIKRAAIEANDESSGILVAVHGALVDFVYRCAVKNNKVVALQGYVGSYSEKNSEWKDYRLAEAESNTQFRAKMDEYDRRNPQKAAGKVEPKEIIVLAGEATRSYVPTDPYAINALKMCDTYVDGAEPQSRTSGARGMHDFYYDAAKQCAREAKSTCERNRRNGEMTKACNRLLEAISSF